MKDKNIVIRVSESTKDKLEQLAKENEMSVSEWIRLQIEIEFAKAQKN